MLIFTIYVMTNSWFRTILEIWDTWCMYVWIECLSPFLLHMYSNPQRVAQQLVAQWVKIIRKKVQFGKSRTIVSICLKG